MARRYFKNSWKIPFGDRADESDTFAELAAMKCELLLGEDGHEISTESNLDMYI